MAPNSHLVFLRANERLFHVPGSPMARCCNRCLTALSAALLICAGCEKASGKRSEPSKADRIEQALVSATNYLISRQSPDGTWRSEVYGNFKNGDSLTPLVLHALLLTPPSEKRDAACRKGIGYLVSLVRPDGTIDAGPDGLTYPVYTAAIAVMALIRPENSAFRPARDAWLTYLRRQQLTEDLGWQPADKEYGGWGYAKDLPRKPPPGVLVSPLTESNLSATVFAVEALGQADCKADDRALRRARIFIQRCQNFADEARQRDPAFDDSGFFFIHDDAVRNKAGVAGKDRTGRERYHSYGSTTADGLRALLACGLPREHPRVTASQRWLERHFSADSHPGNYVKNRESARPALYYYYCSSVAQALKAAGIIEIDDGTRSVRWPELLAAALLERQRPDGSWANPAVVVREDDPLVASALAIIALEVCREYTIGQNLQRRR